MVERFSSAQPLGATLLVSACSPAFREPLTIETEQFVDDPIFDTEIAEAEPRDTNVGIGDRRFVVSRTWNSVTYTAFLDALPEILGPVPSLTKVTCRGEERIIVRGFRKSGDYVTPFAVSYSHDDATVRIELSLANYQQANPAAEPQPSERLDVSSECPAELLETIGRDVNGHLTP